MINRNMLIRVKRTAAIMLCIVLISTLIAPFAVNAKSTSKTVRVGWYESTFNTTGSSGQRSGYGYEYQMKVAAYTGWNYTYVQGSWTELIEMLEEGKIDILSDVSYTKERTKKCCFPIFRWKPRNTASLSHRRTPR